MDKKFVKLAASLSGAKYRSISTALTEASEDTIKAAFNILAVSEGLRSMAITDVPRNWTPYTGLDVVVSHSTVIPSSFVGHTGTFTQAKLDALMKRYDDSRSEMKLGIFHPVDVEVGKALGYFQARAGKQDYDATVSSQLIVPKGRNGFQMMEAEVGPQKIKLSVATVRRVREMSGRWSDFAKSIHPYFVIEFSIVFS
jgi:hypothetical protein